MNAGQLPDELVGNLLAQDSFFASPELAAHRRKVIGRLIEARNQEQKARRSTMIICIVCVLIATIIFGGAASEIVRVSTLPEWLTIILALVIILSALTAALVLGLYLLRYRWALAVARKAAQEQAMLDIPRQIDQLRRELKQLRAEFGNRAENPSDSSEKAFTLLELLVVIAILMILASLLLPALAGVKARGRTAACKNNLGQLGKALTMYESDFHYLPGAGNDADPIDEPPWLRVSAESWLAKISVYLGTNNPVFNCPDYQRPAEISASYGYNAGGSCAVNYPPYDLGLGLGKGFGFTLMSNVRTPEHRARGPAIALKRIPLRNQPVAQTSSREY